MTKQQIRLAAERLIDLAGMAGGSQLVEQIARSGYYGAAIDWVDLLGHAPSTEDRDAVIVEVQYMANRA